MGWRADKKRWKEWWAIGTHGFGKSEREFRAKRISDSGGTRRWALEQRAAGLALPRIAPGEHAWLDKGAPETAAHDLVLNLLTPHVALRIALEAEVRAAGFFESARKQAPNRELSELAAEMAAEEGVHIAWVKSALRRTPDPVIDWNSIFG